MATVSKPRRSQTATIRHFLPSVGQSTPTPSTILATTMKSRATIVPTSSRSPATLVSKTPRTTATIVAGSPKNGVVGTASSPKNGVVGTVLSPKNGVVGTASSPKNGVVGTASSPKNGVVGTASSPKNGGVGTASNPKNCVVGTTTSSSKAKTTTAAVVSKTSVPRDNRIPTVSVMTSSQICCNTDTPKIFPYMQVGRLEVEEALFHKLKMDSTHIEIPDCKDQRFCVLSYDQVMRVSELMNEVVPIEGRGNFPTLDVKLCDLVSLVRSKLEADGVPVKEIRLNGSGASSVLASDFCNISYNDLDLIFTVDLPNQKTYERVKVAVLDSLLDLLPEGTSKKRMSHSTLKEAYVSKMVKVNDTDRWSLIALGNNRTKSVELKFVDRMKRKYEFSVDSFHIMLDTLFLFYDCARMSISDNFYPTVLGESMYGDFQEALYHLHKKLIATKNPEEIRGGGLLKYCNLLVKSYRPAWPEEVKTMERYMCSRFFIDFPDLTQQHSKLVKFLDNHFQGADEQLKYDYLMILYQVVDESTVCLMGHERRQTLALIEDLSCQVYVPQYVSYSEDQRPGSGYSSPSSGSSSSAPSQCGSTYGGTSSGQYSPMSTSSTCSPSLSPKPTEVPDHPPPPVVVPHKFSVPPPSHNPHPAPPPHQVISSHPPAPVSAPPPPVTSCPPSCVPAPQRCVSNHAAANIPTYEIVTSCQPTVMYSNGYYYTSFVPPPQATSNFVNTTTVTQTLPVPGSTPCFTCSCACQPQTQTNGPPPTWASPPQQGSS